MGGFYGKQEKQQGQIRPEKLPLCKWYDAVYEPQAEAVDTEDTSHTEEPQG